MPSYHSLFRLAPFALAAASLTSACGGGGTESAVAQSMAASGHKVALKGGDCSGSCSGGGGTPVPGATNPLPTVAPAPGVLVRESFGPGPSGLRPKSGKGDMRSTFIGTSLGGFWVEWPGSKDTGWLTPSGEATWKFSSGEGVYNSPHELPSPLQTVYTGHVFADVSDGATGGAPAALMPVRLPATPWVLSMIATPSYAAGHYIALGLTDSSVKLANLATLSRLSLLVRSVDGGSSLVWELWQGGATRTLLASGAAEELTYNQLEISYDPQSQLLSGRVNGVAVGSFTMNLTSVRYVGFEGMGLADDFMLRTP